LHYGLELKETSGGKAKVKYPPAGILVEESIVKLYRPLALITAGDTVIFPFITPIRLC